MSRRYPSDKNRSQIVFDSDGGVRDFTTMTMNTIPKDRVITRHGNENFSLRTDDIAGAQTRKPRDQKRQDFFFTDDISGTKPAPSFSREKPPNKHFFVNDIDGATPKIQRSLPHSERHTNPLKPEYELPKVEEDPLPVPKFIRDNINYDDIPGVHPKSYKPTKPAKDLLDTSDIPGSAPKKLIKEFEGDRALDVKDINTGGVFRSKRNTNPLNPQYYIHGTELEQDFGIQHSNYLSRKDNVDLSLRTTDIEGATSETSSQDFKKTKFIAKPNDSADGTSILMLPSMEKQGVEIERQRESDRFRGEKIRQFENRHLQISIGGNDKTQSFLRATREETGKRRYNVTFQVNEE